MKYIKLFFVCFLLLVGCSADFDTFGTSDYNELKDIKFVEQEMGTTIYGDEHLIKITLEAPPESDSTWDSVTIEWISISNMASAHLVESKFKAFPSDVDERDSLAKTLAYDKKALKKGDKIRLPASQVVYLVVVSESGTPSLWKIEFSIPGVEPSNASSTDSDSGDTPETQNSSDSSGDDDDPESSSSPQLNGNNSLTISFKGEIENVVVKDTILVTFAQGTKLSAVVLDTAYVHRKASIDRDPKSITDWSKVQKFTVTAENGEAKTWYVVVKAIQSSENDLMLAFENGFLDSKDENTLAVKLAYGSSIAAARLKANGVTLSPGATIAPKPDTISVWKASQDFVVTAEDGTAKTWTVTLAIAAEGETASSEKELVSISAAGQIEAATIDASNKTVVLHLPNASALSTVQLTIAVSEKASHNFSSSTIDLRQPRELIIHAQDMSSVTWTISADYPLSAEADIESFETEDFTSEVQIDKLNRKITLSVPFGTDLSEVYFSATVSQGASITSPKYGYLDLSSKSAEMVITAANGYTAKWTVTATEVVPAPQIKSIAIGNNGKVAGTIDQSKGTIFFDIDYKKDLNLRSLLVKSLSLSDGATTSDIAEGSSYDFAMPKTVTVSNSAGASKVYTLQAGYQYLNSNFNSWKKDEFGNYNDVEGWDNGNNSYANTLTTSQEGGQVIKMESQMAVVKFASGNMLIAKFNPNDVAPGSMAGYDDGNELIDFGKPFYGRPKYVEFDVKYDGKGDSCDLYLMLESRLDKDGNIRTANSGSNVGRISTDVNTLVASAWYRATTVTSEDDPDVKSIGDAARSGYKTIRLAIHYGKPLTGSPIYASRAFATSLKHKDGIDNHVVETATPDQFPVTHIRVVMASSALGNEYKGSEGATLWVDEMRLIY